mgnify:CR=1 FL=1
MNYFLTGGTGFIGGFLLEKLLSRQGTVYLLVREGSAHKVEALKARYAMASDRIVAIQGDLAEPALGIAESWREQLRGNIDHFFHVAAVYDLDASADSQQTANVDGTRNAVKAAEDMQAGCFHHVSSIAVAGKYEGTFREDMFEQAGDLAHPYFRTKHDSEAVVRTACRIPWRVYRPASVVGHSETGLIDKIDGPYYSFHMLKQLRKALPPWFPMIGVDAGSFNIVPVDFVVDAMDHIAHQQGFDGRCFHLVNPRHYSAGEMLNVFAEAGNAPRFVLRLDAKVFSFIPSGVLATLSKLPAVKRFLGTMMESIGMPADASLFFTWNTQFDNRLTERALEGSGIEVPPLESYARRLWDYWERNLDPELFIDKTLRGNVAGKVVVVTGAGTGIGLASARRLAEAGAKVIISGRTAETLEQARTEIEELGGECHYYTCDIADMQSCDSFIDRVMADHGRIDILINNAGRSIRRAVEQSYHRFHDFERTMQLNYFGALRLALRVLPQMSARKEGHIINIS